MKTQNKLKSKITLFCILLFLSVLAFGQDQSGYALEKEWKEIINSGDNMVSRELFGFVYEALKKDAMHKEIELALDYAAEMQDTDPNSKTFGNFSWYRYQEKPIDLNAVMFCMAKSIEIWYDYEQRLTPAAKNKLKTLMQKSIVGVQNRPVGPGYTNIYLEKLSCLIGLGEILEIKEIINRGNEMLDEWITFTLAHGITEYLSPSYYKVDIQAIGRLVEYSKVPEIREKAIKILKLFYTDIAANWLPEAAMMSGTHSRDYDFRATSDRTLNFVQFLKKTNWGGNFFGQAESESIWKLSKIFPREVYHRYDDDDRKFCINYLTDDYAFSTSGSYKSRIDKSVVVYFNEPGVPNFNLIVDGYDNPFGTKKIPEWTGHHKSLHLTPFHTTSQIKNEAIYFSKIEPGSDFLKHHNIDVISTLKSHFIFPQSTVVYDGKNKIELKTEGQAELKNQDIYLQTGKTFIHLCFLLTEDKAGDKIYPVLMKDQLGESVSMQRITLTHSENYQEGDAGMLGFYIQVASSDEYKNITEFISAPKKKLRLERNEMEYKISVVGTNLFVHADYQTKPQIHTPQVFETDSVVLMINNKEIGRKILRNE